MSRIKDSHRHANALTKYRNGKHEHKNFLRKFAIQVLREVAKKAKLDVLLNAKQPLINALNDAINENKLTRQDFWNQLFAMQSRGIQENLHTNQTEINSALTAYISGENDKW